MAAVKIQSVSTSALFCPLFIWCLLNNNLDSCKPGVYSCFKTNTSINKKKEQLFQSTHPIVRAEMWDIASSFMSVRQA